MTAPEKYAEWMNAHEHVDRRFGHVFRYHPRSNSHSKKLCELILEDLLEQCELIREQARKGLIAYGIDLKYLWQSSMKPKTIDLALGTPVEPVVNIRRIVEVKGMEEVLLSCEAKSCMTEHGKSQPRIYDELSSSHEIVHQGKQEAIAAGISVVNIADQFASPLRQTGSETIHYSSHSQPHVTENMVNHLRVLPIRDQIGEVGFDAYSTVVVNCDNVGGCSLWEKAPAPQPGDRDHYDTFLERIIRFYTKRFAKIR
jgi:hypothetical protein